MNLLVSIIIPCYNAERWIFEAIDSAFSQTYPYIEVIVIDDGSTDASLSVIKSYGNKIKWETGVNRGGNVARNKGFELSQGQYIQWLDADDYLLPNKIEHQVACIEKYGCNVVYGDWRHQYHAEDASVWLDDVHVSGEQNDFLESLLSGWWAAPLAYLVKRQIVEEIGGWDEELKAGQDRDFWIRVAIAGAQFGYQPGCHSIYRRYGDVTVSTKSQKLWCDNHAKILKKAIDALDKKSCLNSKYKKAIAKSCFHIARKCFDFDKDLYGNMLTLTEEMDPGFKSSESLIYNLLATLFGFAFAETLASQKRKFFSSGIYWGASS